MAETCVVPTSVNTSALYGALFGILGRSAIPHLDQKSIALTYDLGAGGQLSPQLEQTTPVPGQSINGVAILVNIYSDRSTMFRPDYLRFAFTAAAGRQISIALFEPGGSEESVFYHTTAVANSQIEIHPDKAIEYTPATGAVVDIGYGMGWHRIEPGWAMRLRIDAGGVAETAGVTMRAYQGPYGMEFF